MMMKSKITDVIISRLHALLRLKEETSPVGHGSSMGMVRETRLSSMLKNYLPNDLGIEAGFICDLDGNISSQLDIVVTDNDPIPTLDFDDHFKLIPIEKVICCVEVKSTLDNESLEQIIKQESSVNGMRRCLGHESEGGGVNIPPVPFSVFALENKASKKRLKDFISCNPWIRQVSVVGQFAFRNRRWDGHDVQEQLGNTDAFPETRISLGWLLYMINDCKKMRKEKFPVGSRRSLWSGYLGPDLL